MKKCIWTIIIIAILAGIALYYYNSNIRANTITDGTFIKNGFKCCG